MTNNDMTNHNTNSSTRWDILWAPWRLSYITEDKETKARREAEQQEVAAMVVHPSVPECFLCQDVAAEKLDVSRDFDQTRHILLRTEHTITVLNKYPYNNGHLLVAPRRHVANLDDLTDAEHLSLAKQVTFWTQRLKTVMTPDGFNVGLNLGHAAGAGLPGHLHWHLVPRWCGDTNFTTVIGATKVIPQSLDALWELLRNTE